MQREALLRTAVEGRTHQQVARDLGLSENALRGLVYRARATLRAAASAIVPPPLVSWALGSGGRGAPALERLAELGAGGGSAGVAGLLMKGGAVAVTASVLAGGIAAVHAHPKVTTGHSTPQVARHLAHPAMMPVALAAARSASVVLAPDSRRARSDRKPPPTHRPGPRPNRFGGQPSTVPLGTAIAPPPHLAPSSTRGSGDGQGRTNGGGGDHNEAQSPSSGVLATGATAATTNGGGGGGGHGEQGSDGGGSSGEGASGSSSANSQDAAFGGSPGDLSTNASRPGESHDRQGPSEASSSTSTNSSSKDEPSLTSGG